MLSALIAVILSSSAVGAQTPPAEAEVRAVFDRFVAAQNAHDVRAVGALLDDAAGFLWITRGTAIWGRDAALARFATLYEGTWRLEPAAGELKIRMAGADAAQLYVPIVFTMGAPGQPAQSSKFLMNMVLVRTPAGWRITSLLPIPAT